MSRTTAAALTLIAQVGLAHAQECAPLQGGGLLCEQEGMVFFVDPASGAVVDVTEEVQAAMAGDAEAVPDLGTTTEAPAIGDGRWSEDRMTDICLRGGCPDGSTGALDAINGYIPSYQ
jgi:hypothetical protein